MKRKSFRRSRRSWQCEESQSALPGRLVSAKRRHHNTTEIFLHPIIARRSFTINVRGSVRTDYESSNGQNSCAVHYCRGCGQQLTSGSRRLFHKECPGFDKQARVRGQRRKEHEKFQHWLAKMTCPRCGARWTELGAEGVARASCEASQGP